MNDPMTLAQIIRAESALAFARETLAGEDHGSRAKSFVELAKAIACASDEGVAITRLQNSRDDAVTKATSAHVMLDSIWQAGDIRQLVASFIASVGEPDLLSAIARYGRGIPQGAGRVLIATGASGNTTLEGFPKLIRRLNLNVGPSVEFLKSTAAIVVSEELLTVLGKAGSSLFEAELIRAVIRAANAAIVASLVDSGTTQIADGVDPLASLRAGIRAAGPSDGYIVAAPAGDVAWLATHEANSGGAGVRGGTFAPGVELVALDDATAMTVIPASRLTVFDGGLELRPTGHATVDMSDDPQAAGEKVSLWQTNSVGLLVERFWRLDGDTTGVVLVGA